MGKERLENYVEWAKGKMYTVHTPDTLAPDSNKEDIIEVKPNFYGIGLNFNAIWRYFLRKKKK
jgi:hypothetical protein